MPSEYRTPSDIHPCLVYRDAVAAMAWLCEAFGFTKQFVVPGNDGTVIHSELSLGTGVIMVCSPKDAESAKRIGAGLLSVYVPDPDAHNRQAVAASATILQPLRDEEYGARGYLVADCEGNQWYFGNYRPGGYWEKPPSP